MDRIINKIVFFVAEGGFTVAKIRLGREHVRDDVKQISGAVNLPSLGGVLDAVFYSLRAG